MMSPIARQAVRINTVTACLELCTLSFAADLSQNLSMQVVCTQ
jgi:hypothetical protein